MVKGPIGVFDSGFGGLTVLEEIQKELPEYDYLYLGDNARAPYGTRSFEVIFEYTWEAVRYLFEQDCSLVILACNTASAKALRTIQQKMLPTFAPDKRVLGVIRPSVEEIATHSKSKHIGILATSGTVKSGSYEIEINKLASDLFVTQHACPMWVPLIENNQFLTEGGRFFIQQEIRNLLEKDPKIDAILLACTHYPLLKTLIQSYVPAHIDIISQGDIVAKSLSDYLFRHPEIADKCAKNSIVNYLTTDDAVAFSNKASELFLKTIQAKQIHL